MDRASSVVVNSRRRPVSGPEGILLVPAPFAGHVYPCLALGEELVRLGHRVWVYGQPSLRRPAREAGIGHVPMANPVSVTDFSQAHSTVALAREMGRFALNVAIDLLRVLEDGETSIVVTDSLHLGAGLAAEKSGLPWASLS